MTAHPDASATIRCAGNGQVCKTPSMSAYLAFGRRLPTLKPRADRRRGYPVCKKWCGLA